MTCGPVCHDLTSESPELTGSDRLRVSVHTGVLRCPVSGPDYLVACLLAKTRGPEDHLDIRILENMVSGTLEPPFVLGLGNRM